MRIPESHIYIVNEKTRAILSTINKSEAYSAFCFIQVEDEEILLDKIDEEQIKHIQENEIVAIMTVDPSNMGRWFCIQGTIEPKETQDSSFKVKIKKLILFPKKG